MAATHLGTFPSKINNSNGIHSVRMTIRNAYRMAKKINVRVGKTGTCRICHSSLLPPPPLLPQPFQMPCCKTLIHPSCQKNWAMCPFCSTPFTALSCCVCRTAIDPGSVYLDWWMASKDCRTPCCESEMHPECVPNLIWVTSGFQGHCALCPLCGVAINMEGQLYKELWEALDWIFMRRQLRINDERRREVAKATPTQPMPIPVSPEWWQYQETNQRLRKQAEEYYARRPCDGGVAPH